MRTNPDTEPHTARPVLRTFLGALAVLAGLLAGTAGPAAAEPPTDDGPTAAQFGAAWLATEVQEGLPLVNFGSPDWGATLDAGIAFAGAGSAQATGIWDALVAERESVVAPFGSDSPGRLAKLVLLAHSLGEDPRAVGDAPGADLVARLEATRQLDGPDAGLFGTDDPTYDGAFRQGIGMVALQAVGATVDPTSISWLEAQQCADGSWMPYRSDLAEACAFDAARFVGPDSNSVAAAVAGLLAAAPGSGALEPALVWLDSNQNPDGGWGFFPGDGSDPNSTALVMQSLIAGAVLDDARFADQAGSPLAALLSFQLGCEAPAEERGAFTYPFSNEAPSLLATTQALPAAAGVSLDHVAAALAPELTPLECDPPATTTTVAPTTTMAPTTTVPPAATVASGGTTPTTQPVVQAPVEVLDATDGGSSGAAQQVQASTLALTGASSHWLLLAGVALLVAGAGLLVASRRNGVAVR